MIIVIVKLSENCYPLTNVKSIGDLLYNWICVETLFSDYACGPNPQGLYVDSTDLAAGLNVVDSWFVPGYRGYL